MRHKQLIPATLLWSCLPLMNSARPADSEWPHGNWPDEPWIDLPEGYVYTPMTEADVRALADLDGDPTVVTEEERDMLALLGQVLLGMPLDP